MGAASGSTKAIAHGMSKTTYQIQTNQTAIGITNTRAGITIRGCFIVDVGIYNAELIVDCDANLHMVHRLARGMDFAVLIAKVVVFHIEQSSLEIPEPIATFVYLTGNRALVDRSPRY